jgi:hypothetical protein
MLLSMAERRLGVVERLARCIPDPRDHSRIAHTVADMIRARVFAICCGYEDANDLGVLAARPGARGRGDAGRASISMRRPSRRRRLGGTVLKLISKPRCRSGRRFASPRQFMAYLGLVPSEHSSGSTRRQGRITKTGNGAAR